MPKKETRLYLIGILIINILALVLNIFAEIESSLGLFKIAYLLVLAIETYIFYKLQRVSENFKKAVLFSILGIIVLILKWGAPFNSLDLTLSDVMNKPSLLNNMETLIVGIIIADSLINIFKIKREYSGFSDINYFIYSDDLSKKWLKLYRYWMFLMIFRIISALLMNVNVVWGIIAVLVSAFIEYILFILFFIYLYKTIDTVSKYEGSNIIDEAIRKENSLGNDEVHINRDKNNEMDLKATNFFYKKKL